MAVVEVNKDNFGSEVEKSELPVIIDFWAEWCGPCKMMGPVFEELSNDYEGKLKFAKVNVDDEPELASRFGIQGIPSLVILKGNSEVDRIVGAAQKESLREKIDSILQG